MPGMKAARFDELATQIADSGNEPGLKVMVLDRDDAQRGLMVRALASESYATEVVADVPALGERLHQEYCHLVIVNLGCVGAVAESLIRGIRAQSPGTAVLALTEDGDVATPVAAIRAGAFDCLRRPVPLAALAEAVKGALHRGLGLGNLQEITPPEGYRILRTIAAGDVSTVLLVAHREAHREHAMKVLISGGNNLAEVRRFFREAKILASIDHPHVVRIHEYGFSAENIPYIIMEYVVGKPLTDLIRDDGFDLMRRVIVLEQVAKALATVHGRGVLHRDIRPCNVLVTPGYTAKLADFGLAGIADSTLTMAREVLGAPAYLSPEAWDSLDAADERSDIFSLGILGYELLTRRRPFSGKTPAQLRDAIRGERPPAPRTINAAIEPAVEDILARMLAKDPARRWQRADEVVEALRLSHERRPGLATRVMRALHSTPATWQS